MNKPLLQKNISIPPQDENIKNSTTSEQASQKGIQTSETKEQKREEFLNSLLRHDLKNKLSIITGFLQLLEDANLSAEEKEFLKNAKKAAIDSSDLINTVRTLTKEGEIETKTIEISSILEDVIEERRKQAEQKSIDIKFLSKDLQAKGGPLLKELFSNLIENSISHSKGGKIRVSTYEKSAEVVVRVEDDGKGIPTELKNKMIEKGYKGQDSNGSGLGMHLSKTIVDLYNGNLEIKDSELGGARFDVHLEKANNCR